MIGILAALSLGQELWSFSLNSEMEQSKQRLAHKLQASNDISCSASVLAHSQSTCVILFELRSFDAYRVTARTSEGTIDLQTEQHNVVKGLCEYNSEFTIALSRLSPNRLRVNVVNNMGGRGKIELESDGEFPAMDEMFDYASGRQRFEESAVMIAPVRIFSLIGDAPGLVVSVDRAAR
jgi:hypothetical protein